MKRAFPSRWLLAPLGCLLFVLGCAANGVGPKGSHEHTLEELSSGALKSEDPELSGRWLLAELWSKGGSREGAKRARARLDKLSGRSPYSELAKAVDDSVHGRVRRAADGFIEAFALARESTSEEAPLIAWFALREAIELRRDAEGLYARHRELLDSAISEPKHIGWRARIQLVTWRAVEERLKAEASATETSAKAQGCATSVRLIGPFGLGSPADILRKYPAEGPAPLPAQFAREPGAWAVPQVVRTDRKGCTVFADENVPEGVYYAETFVHLAKTHEVILAVDGAYRVYVDDHLVSERDPRVFGAWPKWGVSLRLTSGSHRILAKLRRASTAVRVMHLDGTPAAYRSSLDAPYGFSKPEELLDPNILSRFYTPQGVVDGWDDVERVLAADTAHNEGQGDLATLLMAPLTSDQKSAAGPALLLASRFMETDPLIEGAAASDRIKHLEEAALAKDQDLYVPWLSRALRTAEQKGELDGARELSRLARRFPEVSSIFTQLLRTYGGLGWNNERTALAKSMVRNFPDNPEALLAALEVYEQEGDKEQAEKLLDRVVALDRTSAIRYQRALERQDYQSAQRELARLIEVQPDRPELTSQLHALEVRAGETRESMPKLEADLAWEPLNGDARLALADARLSQNQPRALTKAVIEATMAGAEAGPLLDAIDLTGGQSELEPYRVNALDVIRDYEAKGEHQGGTAARVLDYAAIWIRADGSARMLEHEVVRIQSNEAIAQFAESPKPNGLVLHMRVVKKNGQIYEPESVAGKPTVTFPHLEVGDYIETEHIVTLPGMDRFGDRYLGPRWFFREENVAYHRSEFLIISPKNRKLTIETRGQVPDAVLTDLGAAILRRYRVDKSPAAPVEPFRSSIEEYLPSIQVGWGVSLVDRLSDLAKDLVPVYPLDPRIVGLARGIVETSGARNDHQAAEALFRWVLKNVQPGDTADGRRAIMMRDGNPWRAFMELCRAQGIEADFALVRNRLAADPLSPLSEIASYTDPAIRLRLKSGETWVWLNSKYAPFGFLPDEDRGMPAYALTASGPVKARTPAAAGVDGVTYQGTGKLSPDGSAKFELRASYTGADAIGLRQAVAQVPPARLKATLESELFGQLLEGAKLKAYQVLNANDLTQPLVFTAELEVPGFAAVQGRVITITPPFGPGLSRYASLSSRRTPLVIEQGAAQTVDVRLELPAGSRVIQMPQARSRDSAGRKLLVADRSEAGLLHLSRSLVMRAARVEPARYLDFQAFVRDAELSLSSPIRVQLPK